MLEWLATQLRLGQDGSEVVVEELRVWITVCLSFFFPSLLSFIGFLASSIRPTPVGRGRE